MRLTALFALLCVVVPAVACQGADPPLQRDQQAVRAHLKARLPKGYFAEVKSYPGESSKGGMLWDAEDGGSLSRVHHDLFRTPAVAGSAVRLKYRAKTVFGADAIYDKTFFVVAGKVTGSCDTIDFRFANESPEAWAVRTGYATIQTAAKSDSGTAKHAAGEDSSKLNAASNQVQRDDRKK